MNNTFIKLFTCLFLLCPISPSFGGDIEILNISDRFLPDADKQFDFAEQYFSKGEYFKAITEYERFICFFPEDERVKDAMYQIGMAFYESGKFNDAIKAFNELISRYGEADVSLTDVTKAYVMISECYVKLNAYEPAISNLHYLLDLTHDKESANDIYNRIAWIYLEKGDSQTARNYFGKMDDENKARYHINELTAGLEAESFIPRKNPTLAGVLSVIPGGGYLYCERYYDAFTAFLLNGLLIYAAYESFDKDMNALGGLISLVEVGFYTGNIYGSISGVHKYNKNQHTRFVEQLKRSISFSPVYQDNALAFSFHFDF